MDTKKFLTGTVVGGIAYFILGYLFYVVLFGSFFDANLGSATGVMKTDLVWWALLLGNFAGAALLTFIFLKWAHVSTFKGGVKAGASIGIFMALSFDLISYGTSNIMNLTAALVDVVVGTVIMAILGGVIGAVLHAKPSEEAA
jgi:hypothetical protein